MRRLNWYTRDAHATKRYYLANARRDIDHRSRWNRVVANILGAIGALRPRPLQLTRMRFLSVAHSLRPILRKRGGHITISNSVCRRGVPAGRSSLGHAQKDTGLGLLC